MWSVCVYIPPHRHTNQQNNLRKKETLLALSSLSLSSLLSLSAAMQAAGGWQSGSGKTGNKTTINGESFLFFSMYYIIITRFQTAPVFLAIQFSGIKVLFIEVVLENLLLLLV